MALTKKSPMRLQRPLASRYTRHHIRYLLPLLFVLVIQACGFQMRGALEISQDLSPLYLEKNTLFSLGRDIKQLLVSNKVEVTDDVDKANSQLTLIDEKKESRVLSVDTNGRVKEYLLIYTVDFSIQFKKASAGRSDVNQPVPESIAHESLANEPSGIEQATAKLPTKQSSRQQSTAIIETISVKRTLLFNENAVLAVANETEVLYKDMRRDVARLVLLKVQARAKEVEATHNN